MKYIRIFFLSALFFGVWMGIVYSFQFSNVYTALTSAAIAGIVFGFMMAAFSYLFDQKLKKKGIVSYIKSEFDGEVLVGS